jgi:hypothetical protein
LKCRIPSGLISPANQIHISAIPSHTEGRLAIVTNAGRDAVDAARHKTNDVARVRRSRVVLTPRRWCQVGGNQPLMMVARKPGHQGEREVSRKTTAQGRPECFR